MIDPSGYIYSFVIITLSLLFLAINLIVTKRIISNNKYLTIFQTFNIYYIALIYIGAVSLNVFEFEFEQRVGFYLRPDLVFRIWVLCSSALLLMPFGAIAYNLVVQFRPKLEMQNFNPKTAIFGSNNNSILMSVFFVVLLSICIAVFTLYKSAVGDLAVLHIFQNLTPSEFSSLRSEATNNFTGKFSRYQIFLSTVPNFLLIISFLMKSKNFFWKMVFVLSLSLSVFFALINVEKAPVIAVLLLLFFAHLFMYPKINFKKILIIAILGLLGLVLLYSKVMGMADRQLGEIFGAIFHRAFIGQAHPLFWWQMYLEQHGTLGFAGLPNPGGILPFTPVSMTVLLHQYAFPEVAMRGIVGSLPTVYFAYPMLSFGYLASLISMVFFGALMQFIDHMFSILFRSKPNIFQISLYILMIGFFLHYIADGIEGFLFDLNWILPTFICVVYTIFSTNNKRLNGK